MPNTKTYTVERLEIGRGMPLDDAQWEPARVLTDFTFPWTDCAPPATAFRALWNEEALCFRFDVTDSDVVMGDGANAMENVIGSDRVEIFLSTGPELNPYYGIEMDPRGEVLDYEGRFHRKINWDWRCSGLMVKASLTDSGYRVQGAVPMSTIKQLHCLHRDEKGLFLCAGLYRAEFSHAPDGKAVVEDWMSWIDPEVAEPDFHVPTSFGVIRLRE